MSEKSESADTAFMLTEVREDDRSPIEFYDISPILKASKVITEPVTSKNKFRTTNT
jgi:hypothetical protein